jgi:hypothetical protein
MCDKEVHPSHSTSAFRGAATFSMTTLCTTTLGTTIKFSIFSNVMLSVAIKSTVTLSKMTLNITLSKPWDSKLQHSCCYAVSFMMSVANKISMMSVVMLRVIMLNAIVLNAMVPI